MHSRETVAEALRLSEQGLNNCEISRRTGVSRPTVWEWVAGRLPHSIEQKPMLYGRPGDAARSCARCGAGEHRFEVHAYSKSWPCLFPQHDPGKKHERKIELVRWQKELVARTPGLLLRGLLHSDGCRFTNTGSYGWECPRYVFANFSDDIKGIFCDACDAMGLHWTVAPPKSIYVSRKDDVARLDEFVGAKR